jgi:phosphopantothenoylcysteine decarboxylase / phosphopantothenate---cysteine ligase
MRVLITAGPTREPIDAVRYISNRSSGRLGVAMAQSAVKAGHQVTLLLGPGVCLPRGGMPGSCVVERFETAADLGSLLQCRFPQADLLVMAAAVADYRPRVAAHMPKLPRRENQPLVLTLQATPDLVAAMAKSKRKDQRVIAFALEEPAHLEERAAAKLRRKGVDAVVANPLDTMDGRMIDALVLLADGQRLTPGRMRKRTFAKWLFQHLDEIVSARMRAQFANRSGADHHDLI